MKYSFLILIFVLTSVIISCNRIKNKGHQLTDKIEHKAKNKSKDLINKVFPIFDSFQADTRFNKQRFKNYLEIDLTPDIKNIYAFGDFLGADYKVLISFNCDSTTIKKIIEKKALILTEEHDDGLRFPDELFWWDKQAIKKIRPYKTGKEARYWKYLWYDTKTKKAYYEEFSL